MSNAVNPWGVYRPQFTHTPAGVSISDKTVAWTLLPYPFDCLNIVLASSYQRWNWLKNSKPIWSGRLKSLTQSVNSGENRLKNGKKLTTFFEKQFFDKMAPGKK